MSSLRFTTPIYLEGLEEEAANEWVGLTVGLASMFPYAIGHLGPAPIRKWNEVSKIFEDNKICDHWKLANELFNGYMFISRGSLMEACAYSNPRRNHLLYWLENVCDANFFAVDKSMAEYLP